MKSRTISNIIFTGALFCICLSVVLFAPPAFGQSTGNTVVAHPSKETITLSPGKAVKKSILIVNSSTTPLTFKVSVSDVKAADQSGSVSFYQAEGPYSAKTWLVPQYEAVSIAPVSSKTMEYIVSVDKDMPGRGYSGAILLNLYNNASKKVTGEPFGTLIMLNVMKSGITTGGQITSFGNAAIQFLDPIDLSFIVKNQSNSNLSLNGDVVFTSIFGKEVGRFKTGQLDIYPQTSRKFKFQWSDAPIFGPHLATVNLVDLLRKDNIVSSWTLLIFLPWAKLLLFLLALAGLAVTILFLYRVYVKKRHSAMTLKTALGESAKSLLVSFIFMVGAIKNKLAGQLAKLKNVQIVKK